MSINKSHDEKIIEQFTMQAIPFTKVKGHGNSIDTLIEISNASDDDNVLDIACGPGIVSCEFAKIAKEVIGIDITPAMIEEAKRRQNTNNINNISWEIGSAYNLPFADNSFSLVITRYSFHHFEKPDLVLNEMVRVCKSGGKILVADVEINENNSKLYDYMEKLRDPSHTKALTKGQFQKLFETPQLKNIKITNYGVEISLQDITNASFPEEGNAEKVKNMIIDDIGKNNIGVNARIGNNDIMITIPIGVYCAHCIK